MVLRDPTKIVKKLKEMARQNASLEEKSRGLTDVNSSFYKFHYIPFCYKNSLSMGTPFKKKVQFGLRIHLSEFSNVSIFFHKI